MRKVLLRDANPELAQQLVDKSLLETVGSSCKDKVEWECEHGHRWFAIVVNRAKKGYGCPYCSGRLPIPGETDLATTHPKIASELVDQSLAAELKPTSHKKVAWRCEQGHTWEQSPAARVSKGSGCPYCSGRKAIEGKTDLASTHPELAAELVDQSLATKLKRGSNCRVEWRCENGHIWRQSPNARTRLGLTCPQCRAEREKDKTDNRKKTHESPADNPQNRSPRQKRQRTGMPPKSLLIDTHPEIAAQMTDTELAKTIGSHSNKKVQWRCPDHPDHIWTAPVTSRTNVGTGCPYCSGRRILPGFNDIATKRPDLAQMLADPEDARRYTPGSTKRVTWRCLKNPHHTWTSPVQKRANAKDPTTCPICTGKILVVGDNDLATRRPDIASKLKDPQQARTLTPFSSKVMTWKCPTCGTEFQAKTSWMALGHAACPNCAQRRPHPGRTDLATTHPQIAAELVNQSLATKLTRGSNRLVEWECPTCHHRYMDMPNNRVRGHGCPCCAGYDIVPGVNDIATTHPEIAAQLVDQTLAIKTGKGSHKRLLWRCEHGHVWKAAVYNRTKGNTGCPVCARNGTSDKERALANVVRRLLPDADVRSNVRDVLPNRLELDVYVPSLAFAVEFHGCYWHSEACVTDPKQHLRKLEACERMGIQLVQIWEDTWDARPDVVCAMLAHKLHATDRLHEVLRTPDDLACSRAFARQLEPVNVTGHDSASFLEMTHLQGTISATIHLGLEDDQGRLRALMSIRSPRAAARMRREPGEWEIVRYATHGSVPGGFSRLLAHAERELRRQGKTLTKWVTFADRETSDGSMYEACGFSLDHMMPPNYSYVSSDTDWIRIPKERYQLKRFRDDPNLEYEKGWTERQCAEANGLLRTWDSGKLRYVRKT